MMVSLTHCLSRSAPLTRWLPLTLPPSLSYVVSLFLAYSCSFPSHSFFLLHRFTLSPSLSSHSFSISLDCCESLSLILLFSPNHAVALSHSSPLSHSRTLSLCLFLTRVSYPSQSLGILSTPPPFHSFSLIHPHSHSLSLSHSFSCYPLC